MPFCLQYMHHFYVETDLEDGKYHSKPNNYFKALGSLLNTNQTTQSYPGKIN